MSMAFPILEAEQLGKYWDKELVLMDTLATGGCQCPVPLPLPGALKVKPIFLVRILV